ncbi:MAG: NUDIX hydrolase [Nocardioidaceae bacterium]|nr:NUDIX hydrolase [Nocardioidaceae bacterium]
MTDHHRLPGQLWEPGQRLADEEARWPVEGSRRPYDGDFVQLREDDVRGLDGEVFTRVVVEHQGAVGVVALDEDDRVLALLQYRHAAGARLVEVPAGILDVAGEEPQQTAARELAEEAGVVAHSWSPLLRMWASPGMTDEYWHLFVARDLSPAAPDAVGERRHEEADIEVVWVPLTDAVRAVLDGRITSPIAVAGLLAVWAGRTGADITDSP